MQTITNADDHSRPTFYIGPATGYMAVRHIAIAINRRIC